MCLSFNFAWCLGMTDFLNPDTVQLSSSLLLRYLLFFYGTDEDLGNMPIPRSKNFIWCQMVYKRLIDCKTFFYIHVLDD